MPESLHLLLIGCLSHLEDQRGLTKPEILSRDVAVQEDVDAYNQTENQSVIISCAEGPLSSLGLPSRTLKGMVTTP